MQVRGSLAIGGMGSRGRCACRTTIIDVPPTAHQSIVTELVADLLLDALVALLGVALLGGAHGEGLCALRLDRGQRKEAFEVGTIACGARRVVAGAHQELEAIAACAAGEIVKRHDGYLSRTRNGGCSSRLASRAVRRSRGTGAVAAPVRS